jgi:spermidine synthase
MAARMAAVLVLGASGLVAQVVLLRELVIPFQSNELTIGLILATWLLAEALGSLPGGRLADRAPRAADVFVPLTLLFAVAFPGAVWQARAVREMVGVPPGEGFSILQSLWASLVVLVPPALLHGALFGAASSLVAREAPGRGTPAGRVYLLETLGTIAGGLLFNLLLLGRLSPLRTAFLFSLANALASLALARDPGAGGERPPSGRVLLPAAAAVGIAAALLLIGPWGKRMEEVSAARRWHPQDVRRSADSRYGNLTVTERQGQYTFHANGLPVITTPVPDVAAAEDFAHLALLHHPRPDRVLLLSGGVGGLLAEILAHPVTRVDYAEVDPLLLAMVRDFPTPVSQAELDDPRVHLRVADGRLLVKGPGQPWDLIMSGLGEPQDLQTNRLYTREFFAEAAARLAPGGILALRLPGSLTYLGPEVGRLNATILATLREVFPVVRVLPGDGANLFLASRDAPLPALGAADLAARYRERRLAAAFVTPAYLAYRLDPTRTAWLEGILAGFPGEVNRDFRPLAVHQSLAHWNALFSPQFSRLYALLDRVGVPVALVALVALTLPVAILTGGWRRRPAAVVPFLLFTTGLAGMVVDLVLILAYQSIFGHVYAWVGLLITVFMGGTALGSFLADRLLVRVVHHFRALALMEAGLALFALALPVFLPGLGALVARPAWALTARLLFFLLALVAGALVGLEFPLANRICLGDRGGAGGTAGLLYGADLLGGWLGGMVGALSLFPLLGLGGTGLLVAAAKGIGLFLLGLKLLPQQAGRAP